MRKLVLICTILYSFILWAPPVVHAAEETSKYFTVNVKYDAFSSIGPGDTLTDTFTIENTADQKITVRLYDVENVDNSVLYSVLTAGWINDGRTTALGSLDDLANGPNAEWHSLDPGEVWTLTLDMHFPEECGNKYQGTALIANFVFETRIPNDETLPQTGDISNPYAWAILMVISGCLILFLLREKKRNTRTTTNKDAYQTRNSLIIIEGGDSDERSKG